MSTHSHLPAAGPAHRLIAVARLRTVSWALACTSAGPALVAVIFVAWLGTRGRASGSAARSATASPGWWWGFGFAEFAAFTIAMVAGTAVSRARSQRLARLETTLAGIGRGDLGGVVDVERADEIGAVAEAAAAVVDRLRRLVAGVSACTIALESHRGEVDDIAAFMMSSAEVTATQVIAAGTAAVQVSGSTRLLAAATEELATTIQSVAENAAHASAISVQATHRATTVQSTVGELSSASRSVGEITDLITAIASRTRLLSLNARIEAVRAGAAGQGFAIVAGEVKELANQTAHATSAAGATLADITEGSGRATEAIDEIASTIAGVTELQSSIAGAVEQQSQATISLGRACADVATGASEIEQSIERIAGIARDIAYGGPAARNTAAEMAEVQAALRGMLDDFRGVAAGDSLSPLASGTTARAAREATTVAGVTTVTCDVVGSGVNQFDYAGTWCHTAANQVSGDADAYSSMPGDVAMLRFAGRRVRLFCNTDAHHGIMAVSVDDGPETEVDQYSPQRQRTVLSWESPLLQPGPHLLRVRVLPTKNAESRYFWVTVDRAEVE